jgi:fluoride exporter
MTTALYVALFGAAGSLCRWLMSAAVQRVFGHRIPAGTFAVNILGSLAIGVVMAYFASRGADSRLRVAMVTGFLGGFTTYSAFAYESWALFEQRTPGAAVLYIVLTIGCCLAACAAGVAIGRAIAT